MKRIEETFKEREGLKEIERKKINESRGERIKSN